MNKITTADCKELIVEHVKNNVKQLENEFVPPEDMAPAMLTKNWKRREKSFAAFGISKNWERAFDCEPYDDQLRAYVVTNETDTEVLSIEVLGE